MKRIKQLISYFTKFELALWCSSIALIIASYLIFDRNGYLTLIASLIGVTSLIYNAKGNPIGQVLIIIFSIFYGIISYSFAYYGEMLTYLGMSAPMALIALISWLKNPYKGNKAQVKVNRIRLKEIIIMLLLSVAVTVAFYFILDYFNTANIIPSTLSVTTSFIAAYLTFRRSPYYAFAYALNDIVLIVMWILASLKSIEYVSVIICFLVFLVNDLYGFVSWLKMERQQKMP
ncbi:MAG: nicotinamide mononucleotide transporter [Clostridia bacterium]|nr:nicotinamide mononucleotide transporter [Clostridia bacterium]